MTVGIVIQARTGSRRLPGKVLAELAGRPMLGLQLERLTDLDVDAVCVATSDRAQDDAVADLARSQGVRCVRGSESDVLGRYEVSLEEINVDHVVRLTADCPLTDPRIVGQAIDLHLESGVAYTSNVHPRSYPTGLDVEVMSASALRRAATEAVDAYDREHVTPYIHRQPDLFPAANLRASRDASSLRWTVDTEEDLAHVRTLVGLVSDPVSAAWKDYLAAAEAARLTGRDPH